MSAGRLGWSQQDFDFTEPRYLFNAIRGRQREGMEQARLIAYFSKVHIEGTRLSLDKFAIFPWENEKDYAPRFGKIDPEAFARIEAWQFPDEINNN